MWNERKAYEYTEKRLCEKDFKKITSMEEEA